jgi:methionyl-tRNA formyltransferase
MTVARTGLRGPFPDHLDLGANGIQVVDNRVFGICGDRQVVEILEWFPAKN